jgi:uncharacterized protein YjbI with pentapeptide repeats
VKERLASEEKHMTKEDLVQLLREDITKFNQYRETTPHGRIDLRGVDLNGVDLSGANLCGVDFWGADLRWANLSEAELQGVYLVGASIYGTILPGEVFRAYIASLEASITMVE